MNWRTVLGAASVPILAGLFLAIIGALNVFQNWSVGPLRAGQLVILLLALWVGLRAAMAEGVRKPSLSAERAIAGMLAGAFCGLVFGLVGSFFRAIDVRRLLVRVSAETGSLLTFGLDGPLAVVGPALIGLALGAAGVGLAVGARAILRGRAAAWSDGWRHVESLAASERWSWTVPAAVVVALAAAGLVIGSYWNHVLTSIGLYVLLGLGLNIVVGYAGLLDLGYVAFFAIGAYGYAFLTPSSRGVADLTFWLAVPLVMLLAAIGGVLLGVPVLRLRGDYLAIVTLGFGEIIRLLVNNLTQLTGGPQGVLRIPHPEILGYELINPMEFFYLVLIACILVAFASARLNDSRIGRAWIAIREDEDVARALGINVWRYKLLAFGIGASFAGLGGAIFASRQSAIFPVDFTLLVSIYVLCLVIIGGMGSIPGVVVGSAILVGLPEVLRELADYRLLAFGFLLVLTMIVRPQGLLPQWRRAREIARDEADEGLIAVPQSGRRS